VGRLVRAAAGGRLAVFLHGTEVWGPLPAATRRGLAGADLVIANSAYTLRRFREAHPRLAGVRGEVCPLPARDLARDLAHDPIDGDPSADPAGPPDPRPPLRVLVVGRLWGRGLRKGQKELIALWPRVRRALPGAELWIVGGGEGRGELTELARQAGVADAVVFPGEVSDARLARLYAASDLYAMPSWGEGFGLVFAEAMAHGLPCIASRLDAGAEVVADGETGLLVDPQDPNELYGALLRLLGDPALRARLGAAGRRRARELYSFERFAGRLTALLGEPA
jgi:phosphatidyl-myo-inositol dimannoside synthase